MKKRNEVEMTKGQSAAKGYIQKKHEAIIEMFNENHDAGKNIYSLPIYDVSFMNISSGSVYGPSNAAYLNGQMNALRREVLIKEYRKNPLLNEKLEQILEKNRGFQGVLNLNNELIKMGRRSKRVKDAIEEAKLAIEQTPLKPYFFTWNQGKNIYDVKGSKKFIVIQKFFFDSKGKKKDEDNDNDLENDNINDSKVSTKEEVKETPKQTNNEENEENKIFRTPKQIGIKEVGLFNYSQARVLPGLEEPKAFKRRMEAFERPVQNDEVKTLITALSKTSLFPIVRSVSLEAVAYMSSTAGIVNIPPSENFKSNLEELSVLAHEIAHSYGEAAERGFSDYKRFAREFYVEYDNKPEMRAAEELIANIAAGAFLSSFNIKSDPEQRESALIASNHSYDLGWGSLLRDKPDMVVKAVEMAEKIVNQMSFLVKKELKLMYEKDPTIPLPALAKEEIVSQKKKEELDPEIAKDYSPTIKEDQVSKVKKPPVYRRGR